MKNLRFFTDGACSGNPGYAGISCYLENTNTVYYEHIGLSTNNIAELKAIETVLNLITINENYHNKNIEILTDSKYSIMVITAKWRAKKNTELIHRIRDLYKQCQDYSDVELVKIKGHSGIVGNEIADAYAVKASQMREKGVKIEKAT